ncbi:major head protein [uncultured Mediterranean phage uvDeep-CGR0-AD1-C123]|nr:major head protein [uncultured Mediterranean phage uvDeep-CGR0-AD1-C123]
MATYTTATSIGQREDLKQVISRIDPSETPIVANAKMETTKAVNHEWLVQELTAAVDTNLMTQVPLGETALAA